MTSSASVETIVAVIVTRDRPALLRSCLEIVLAQTHRPDQVIVIDNASGPETAEQLRSFPTVRIVRLPVNTGGAGGFKAGVEAGMAADASWLWLMDDDGRPANRECLARLLARARTGADLVGALVVDVECPDRLAFPIRIGGRTLFDVDAVAAHGPVHGFAHLFNGALVSAALVRRIGPPDARFFIRGDEVEFLFRARRSGARIVLETDARFIHPGSTAEIHPILGGRFYAVLPADPTKRFYQFRNRGYIFRRYGMWTWLIADVVRYSCFFLVQNRGDVRGLLHWGQATAIGVLGRFMSRSEVTAQKTMVTPAVPASEFGRAAEEP